METIFVKRLPTDTPKLKGIYFLVYEDGNDETGKCNVLSSSEWTQEVGWKHGAAPNMIYWLEEIELPKDVVSKALPLDQLYECNKCKQYYEPDENGKCPFCGNEC